jgi:DNA-binding MarR family transcriptional regulator
VRRGEAIRLDSTLYEGLAGFRSILRRFLAFSEAATREAGVTPGQYQALLVIKVYPTGAIMIRELAGQMLLQHHGAVQLVDRLVRMGLVARRQSTTDRRSVLVILTAKGSKLLERLASAHSKELLRHEPLLAESLRRLRQIERRELSTNGRSDRPNTNCGRAECLGSGRAKRYPSRPSAIP